jgi:hypothetical protein
MLLRLVFKLICQICDAAQVKEEQFIWVTISLICGTEVNYLSLCIWAMILVYFLYACP